MEIEMAARGICSVENCGKSHKARGWCGQHYSKWKRLGDPRATMRCTDETLTHERVHNALDYDPATGICTWKILTGKARPGEIAGHPMETGHLIIGLDGETYLAHRLIWFWMTGEWPPDQIDHVDVDGSNNRWSNLRLATDAQNRGNTHAYKNNKLGVKGVWLHHKSGKYRAMIRQNRKGFHLGVFDTVEEARAAYAKEAARRFGEFARLM